ncbi:MAG: LysM peptidoglycan-binding domain-containing protein [Candidatus Methylomirabilales bacterium]
MQRNRLLTGFIAIATILSLSGCTLLPLHSPPTASPQQQSHPTAPASDTDPDAPPHPPQPPRITVATSSPLLPSPPLEAQESPSDDPPLTEARELLQQARHEEERGRDAAATTLLTRARALLLSDGAALTPEARRRREDVLNEMEALSDELAAIRAMSAIPSEGEALLVSPEDVSGIELAIPAVPPPWKPETTYDIPMEINAEVHAYVELLTTTKRDQIAAALERSGRYLPLMRQIFAEKGLPQDLINLAYIESSFKLYAYSRARAVGIWQFIRGTARKYGLTRNWWVDERRDPAKATRAAAEYLSDLYSIFGSWPLAIAAYNAGEGKVLRAMKRQKTTDFWRLKLPRETKFYVPAFMAMTIIAKDPEGYGFIPPVERPWQVDQVTLPQPTDLRLLAKAARVSTEELRNLNPELRRLVTPPQKGYLLNLPPGSKATFLEALARLPKARRVAWRRHRIRRGETLSTIAQRYRTTVPVLMEMNRLRSPHRIRAGTRISVPVPTITLARRRKTKRPTTAGSAVEYVTYIVKPGDNLWEIARAHQVNPHDLERWNNLHGSLIHPGRTLRIYLD